MPPTFTRDPNRLIPGLTVDDEFVLTEIARHYLEKPHYSTDTKHPADEDLAGSNQDSIEIIISFYQKQFIPFPEKSREDLVILAFYEGADFSIRIGGKSDSLSDGIINYNQMSCLNEPSLHYMIKVGSDLK